MRESQHLIIFDDSCGLCQRSVLIALNADKERRFLFAPIGGKTAKKLMKKAKLKADSFILIENIHSSRPFAWVYGRGVLRLFWLLGGSYKVIGALFILPKICIDPIYRFIAKRRKGIGKKLSCALPRDSRFLP